MSNSHEREKALLATDLHVEATYRLTEALVEAENRMRRRVELLSEVVFEADPSGALVFLNRAWGKTVGHPPEKCLGLPLRQYVRGEDLGVFELAMLGKLPAVMAGQPRIRLIRADGGVAWVEISATPLADGGVVGALHDVTAEKRAQDELAKLSLVASYTDNFVIITDRNGLTEWVNPAFTRRTGYQLGDMLGRKPGEVLQGPDTDAATVAQVREYLREGRSFKAELLNYTRSGEPYWVTFQISPIRDAEGRVERFVSVQTDSTELRRARRDLETAKERAEQMAVKAMAANEAKSEFLATMSHEIRTPMNGILGMAELLQQTPLDAHQRELTETVVLSGQALLRIINDILDFSKIEAGQMKLIEEEFDLMPLVNGIVSLMARSGHGKPVTVGAECDPAVPPRLCGDAGRLRQVLLNLLGNGLKFTAAGSVVIRIRLIAMENEAALLRFEVVDTGVGIPADKIPILFQPFQQVDSSPSRRHGGTGLGLAISRRLIQIMGGRMGVKSGEGKGSTFWFELAMPVALSSEAAQAKPLAPGSKVLVAQEHDIHRRLCLLSLQKLDCRAETAGSAGEALALFQKTPFDAVIFDTQMTDKEGGEFAAAIRKCERTRGAEARPPVLLVALVASESAEDQGRLISRGVNHCLVKPPSLAQLRQALFGTASNGATAR